MNERNAGFRIASGAHPAFDRHKRVARRLTGENPAHIEISHIHKPQIRSSRRFCPVLATSRRDRLNDLRRNAEARPERNRTSLTERSLGRPTSVNVRPLKTKHQAVRLAVMTL